MVQVILQGKIYTIDGDDAVLVREAVAALEKTASTHKEDAQGLTNANEVLKQENIELKTKLGSLEGELVTTKTTLDEAINKQTQTDAQPDVDKIIKEGLDLWNQVLPILIQDDPDYKPDMSLCPLEIKTEFVFKTCTDEDLLNSVKEQKQKLEDGDEGAKGYLEGLFKALIKGSTTKKVSHTDSVLNLIMTGRHVSQQQDKNEVNYSELYRQKIEAKNPK